MSVKFQLSLSKFAPFWVKKKSRRFCVCPFKCKWAAAFQHTSEDRRSFTQALDTRH